MINRPEGPVGTIPSLYMGPNVLRFQEMVIKRVVKPQQSGNYVLGDKNAQGELVPMFIGRSDTDLRSELKSKFSNGFRYFKFSINGPVFGFQLECAQFHSFQNQIQNRVHTQPPIWSGMKCFFSGAS